MFRSPTTAMLCCLLSFAVWQSLVKTGQARAADVSVTQPQFYRGLNLNGPPVVIDGQAWEGGDAKDYVCKDKAFENQDVKLVPPTDPERAKMIRSSRWGGNEVTLTNVPSGQYSVFLYVWEDNNAETFSVALNGRAVLVTYSSGSAGHWERLGPWLVDVTDGTIRLTSRGGAANFSGIEVWRGEHDGSTPADRDPAGLELFEKRIRPLLVKHCYECHSADSKEVKGDLLVDTRAGMRRGGFTGPAVMPGDVERSLLIEAVKYGNDDMKMPPTKRLAESEIADLEAWVKLGAPDPRQGKALKKKFDISAGKTFWSLQPIIKPPVPVVADADWSRTAIDRFLKPELDLHRLRPLGLADKRTLLRRATFDLTGLPPTPDELNAFVADNSPEAFAKVVDRLLASPRYGERWGRHWMDLVRYADTAGDNSDYPIPQAYRYRNYIIDAFNADKPYDQFLREQIAGDLLPAANDAERNERIIATGYIASSRRFGSIIQGYPQHLTIEDTIDNLGRTVLGLTINCARCHDHKFDPISQEDYYGLYGIFNSTKYPFPGIELDKKPRDFVALHRDGKPGTDLAYAVSEQTPGDARVHVRGEPNKPGELVPRRFLEVLGGKTLTAEEAKSSGRLQLAQWLTEASNPLTARVMANRIWQQHFGTGLVPTPSDFGVRGQPPTHPQLLDYLASTFQSEDWSLKRLHRQIMLSRAYQLASGDDSDNLAIDPQNAYHWRFSRRRLDAESLRDTLLTLSGDLDVAMPNEPHPFPPADKWEFTQHHPFRAEYPSHKRSVYLMTSRLTAIPFFTTFDGADRNASTPRRDNSVTTLQSLYLLNDEFLHRQATGFAARLLHEDVDGDEARLSRAFEYTVARPATPEEQAAAKAFLRNTVAELQAAGVAEARQLPQAWESLARVLLRMNEFLYID